MSWLGKVSLKAPEDQLGFRATRHGRDQTRLDLDV